MEHVLQYEGYRPRAHKQISVCQHGPTTSVPGPASPHGHAGRGTELPAHPASWIPLQIWWSHSHWGELASLESGVAQLGCRESGCSVLSICTWQAAQCRASWARLNHHQHAAISPWSHLLAVGRCQSVLLSHHRAFLEGEAGETGKALDLPFSLVAKIGGYWESDPFKPPLSTIKPQIAQVWRWCAIRCRANCPGKGFHPGKPTSPSLSLVLPLWGWGRAAPSPLCTLTFRTP